MKGGIMLVRCWTSTSWISITLPRKIPNCERVTITAAAFVLVLVVALKLKWLYHNPPVGCSMIDSLRRKAGQNAATLTSASYVEWKAAQVSGLVQQNCASAVFHAATRAPYMFQLCSEYFINILRKSSPTWRLIFANRYVWRSWKAYARKNIHR
jgi:hypothetical protein